MPFFYGRGVAYLVVWFVLAALTLFTTPATRASRPIGLPLLALTFTFAAIDLTMSLDPAFNSSIYGLLQGTSAVLLALSVAGDPGGADDVAGRARPISARCCSRSSCSGRISTSSSS